MKRKYFFIVTLILIITSIFSTNAMATNDLNNDIIKTEKQSNIEYNKLLKTYSKIDGYIDPSKIDYPNYYAGAYLNGDKELVVLATDNNINNNKEMKAITQNENLIIKSAKYSYNHLNKTMNKINDYMIANQESDDTLYSAIKNAAVYDDKNYILVHLEDVNDETIKLFKNKISDSDAIIFEKEEEPMVYYTNINAGQKISLSISGSSYSMGYRCKRKLSDGTFEYGFVTAAHGNLKGNEFSVGSTKVGVVTARKHGGSTDASFVNITNSNYTASNTISGTSLSLYPYGYYSPAVGSTVKKSGYATGVTSGQVTNINYSDYISDVWMTNMTQVSLIAKVGDSGGIVFSNDSTDPYLAGIVAGGNSTSMLYTKYGSIMNDLDVYHY